MTTRKEQQPAEASATLARIRRAATLLDDAFAIPGTKARVGVDSLIGLIPGVGDAIGLAFSTVILWQAYQMGASKRLLLRMLFNVGVDALLGAVPLLGDWHDVVWKANVKNVELLERQAIDPAGLARASGWFLAGVLGALVALALGTVLLAVWLLRLLLGL